MAEKPDDRTLMVEFTAEGQVRPSLRAAEHLARLGGLWRLVPEVGHMMLLERVGLASHSKERQVRLAGTFESNHELHNAISVIAMGQQDGALHVSNGDHYKTLYFRRGILLSARSSLPEDRLGNVLVTTGMLSEQDRDRCLPDVRAGQPLGTVLVSKGIMTTPKVYDGLRRQTEEIFYSILPWQRGAFYLVAPLDMTEVPAMLHLSTNELLMDGVRRLDEEGPEETVTGVSGLHRTEPVRAKDLPENGPELIVEVYNKALRGLFAAVGERTAASIRTSLASFVHGSLPFIELFKGVEVAKDGALSTTPIIANIGKKWNEATIRNMQLGLSEVLFFALFAAGEEVTPALENRIQGIVAKQLRELPRADRKRGAIEAGAPTATVDFDESTRVSLSKVAAAVERKLAEGNEELSLAEIFDESTMVESEEDSSQENSIIAQIVDEEFQIISEEAEPFVLDEPVGEAGAEVEAELALVESESFALEEPEQLTPLEANEADELVEEDDASAVEVVEELGDDAGFELSLDQDEEIMSLLDKVAEATEAAESVVAKKPPPEPKSKGKRKSKKAGAGERSPSAEFDRLLEEHEEDDAPAEPAVKKGAP